MKTILTRLIDLEKRRGDCITVLAEVDGAEREMSVAEFCGNAAARFVRVLRGTRLNEVDAILSRLGIAL